MISYKNILKPPLGTLINKSHPLSHGLIFWPFNERGGDVVKNVGSGGAMYDGAFQNSPTWVDSDIGYGVQMEDAGDRYVLVPHHPSLNPSGDVTLGASFSTTDQGSYVGIIGKWKAGTYYCINFYSAQDNLRFVITDSSYVVETGRNRRDGNVHQVIGVRKGDYGYLYVDGELTAEGSLDASAITNDNDFAIGSFGPATSYILDGTIHYGFVYPNRALSYIEVMQWYRNPFCVLREPYERTILSYPTEAGATIPVFVHHYKQAGGL